MPQQTEQQRQAAFQAAGLNQAQQQQVIAGQPAAQSPVAPTPQMQTPPTPQPTSPVTQPQAPSTTVNVNTSPTPEQKPQQYAVKSGDTLSKIAQQQGMSVIDLINQNPQYQQNPNLIRPGEMVNIGKKYQQAFEDTKGKVVPESMAEARQQAETYAKEKQPQQTIEDMRKAQMDDYLSMHPAEKYIFDQAYQAISAPATTQTFKEELTKAFSDEAIPVGRPGESLSEEQMNYLNIQNIMDGTEDDIRNEIAKAGGFATESQVQAMVGARNKTLLKQANLIQQSMALKQDYVDQLMRFSQLDRAQVEKEVDRKLGLTEKMAQIQEKMTTAARDNYQKVIDKVGYQGLADALGGDKYALRTAESTLGLPSGSLSNKDFLTSTISRGTPTSSIQEYEYAKSQGYKGTFTEYQNEDANRKMSIASAGAVTQGAPTSYKEWELAGKPGTYEQWLKDANVKAPTVAQQTVAEYAARIEQANPLIDSLEDSIVGMNIVSFNTQVALPPQFQSSKMQQYMQAARNFINAKLRRESGAVINPTEFAEARQQYLPQPGDSNEVLTQKKANRDLVYASLKKAAGNAYVSVEDLLSTAPKSGDTQLYNGATYKFDGKNWVKQ